MQVALYVHPFDFSALDAQGGLSRLRDMGVRQLSLASSYHDGRWLTPWHPQRRIRFLEDGCTHFRPSSNYGLLQPQASSEVSESGPSPLEKLCLAAPSHGLSVRSWAVLGHNSRLGLQHPELTVANAYGDRYPYALCPSQQSVQDYFGSLIHDLAGHRGLDSIELEALGQMGFSHSSHHDKRSIDAKGLLAFALSACFCDACLEMHRRLGSDGDAVRVKTREFIAKNTTDADAMEALAVPFDDAGLEASQAEWVEAILAVRRHIVASLARLVRKARGNCRIALQVHPDRWFTGSQLSVESAQEFSPDDERVLTCYGSSPSQVEDLLTHSGMQAISMTKRRVCIWPKAPQFTSDDDLRELKQLCSQQGVDTIAIYHLGLLPWRTVERAARILSA